MERYKFVLHETNEKYHLFFENMSEAFLLGEIICDKEGSPCDFRYLDINLAHERLTGLRCNSIINKTPRELGIIPDPLLLQKFGEAALQGEQTHFDCFSKALGKHLDIYAFGLEHRVFGAIFFDVTERKLAEAELARSKRKTAEILESIQDGVITIDREWSFTYINKLSAEYFDLKPGGLAGKNLWEAFPELIGTAHEIYIRNAMKLGEIQRYEIPGVLAQKWYSIAVYPSDEGITIYWQDITERKRSEQALQISEARLRVQKAKLQAVLDAAPAMIVMAHDPQCRLVTGNRMLYELHGLPPESNLTEHIMGAPVRFQRDGHEISLRELPLTQCAALGKSEYNSEFEMILKNGESVSLFGHCVPLLDEDGKSRGAAGIYIDQTERKHAEEKLIVFEEGIRTSQQDLNRAQAVARTGSWRLDINRNELLWSEETYRIFDLPKDTPMTYESFLSRVHPEDREHVDRNWKTALQGNSYDIEHRIMAGDGVKWVREKAELEFDTNGILQGGFGTVQDITDRKDMEKALRESEERFRSAFDKGAVPMALTAPDSKFIMVNPAFSRMVGYSESELSGMSFYKITHPDDIPLNKAGIDAIVGGEKDAFRMEKRYIRKDGQVIWVDISTASVRDANGTPLYVVTHAQDITERKRAEDALSKKERELQLVMDTVPALICYVNTEFKYERANHGYERWFGLKRDEVEGHHIRDVLGETSWELVRPRLERAMSGETVTYEEYMPYRNGQPRWVEATFVPDRGETGNVRGIVAHVNDITERKLAEERLRKNEERFRHLIDTQQELICRIRPDGAITYVNPACCRMAQETEEELLGSSVFRFLQEKDVERAKKILSGATPEKPDYFAKISISIGTEKYFMQWTGRAIFGPENKILEYQGVGRDITRERTALKALSESRSRYRNLALRLEQVREEERAAIARELHDNMGQTIAGLRLDLAWLAKRIPGDDRELKNKLKSIQEYVKPLLEGVRILYTQLRPGVLDELGIISAIESLLANFELKTGIGTRLEVYIDDKILNRDQITALYRIIQEGLTNIFRHANATEVTVSLFQKDEEVILRISDNGKGILKSDLNKHSFGLLGMQERVKMLGGKFEIEGKPGKGSVLNVSIPINPKGSGLYF